MKKIILVLNLIFIWCNPWPEDREDQIKIEINYQGEYCIFFDNYIDDDLKVFITAGENETTWYEDELEMKIDTLDYLAIIAYKWCEPYDNNLTIKLYGGDDLLDSTIAEDGIREAKLFYQF